MGHSCGLLAFALSTLLLWGCDQHQPLKHDKDIASVENVLQELISSDNKGDLKGVMSHYAENAVLMSPNGVSIAGHENIETHYGKIFENSTFLNLKAVSHDIRVQGNMATIAGINYGSIVSKKDSTDTEIHGKFMMLFEKQGGSWKITRLIWNDAGSRENLFTPNQ
ncbi:MAG: SgcJ/EcaC family oxidoreductase [Allomuricauda sp.]